MGGKAAQQAPSPAAGLQDAPTNSPASYTPKHLAEKIINSRSAIEGERKLVTVLFADLKGSTEMIADQDPEMAQKIFDPLINLMMEAVHFYEGTVSLVLGDGLMAIFGAPVAHEDHAVRACYAALRIQENAAKLAEDIRARYKHELSVRIGLNSGDVVVRSVGSDLRMDYSAIGHTTHLASRFEQLAEPGSVLLGPATARLVEGYVRVESCGEKQIKGLEEPQEVFELLGASAVQSRLQAAVARGLTTFLGRGTEIELMNQAMARSFEGQGQVIALSGEAGIGKSRLMWEFIHSIDGQKWAVRQASPSAYGKAVSYGPIIGLLRGYFGIEDSSSSEDVVRDVTDRLVMLDTSLAPLAAGVLSLLGYAVPNAEWDGLDPQARRRRLIDGLRTLLLLESRIKPVVIVMDDLHWIDDETQEMLDALVDGLPSVRIFLLVGYRPEYEHDWARKSYFREIRIAPLAGDGAKAFLDSLLGNDHSLVPLKQLLINRTDGNPFFMEESVRTLHEMNFIGGSAGGYKLLKATESVRIPESAKAILSARIDRLTEDDKRVLQAAAVIGKDVPFALLARICDIDEAEVRDAMVRLQSQEFLYEASLFPELIYTFRHSLVQEVSYDSLLGDRRIGLHQAIVTVSEEQENTSLERLSALACHAFRGELWDKAVAYLSQSGRKAVELSALVDAKRYFNKATEAIEMLPSDPSVAMQGIDLQFDLRGVLVLLGNLQEAKRVLLQAQKTAREAGDRFRDGMSSCLLCNLYWELGEQDLAIEEGLAAQDIARETDDAQIASSARRYLARAYQAVGDYDLAISLFSESLPRDQKFTPSHLLIRAFLSNCLAEIGNFSEAMRFAEETVALAEELMNPLALSASLSSLGRTRLHMGRFQEAALDLERALKIAEDSDIELLFPYTAAPLGAAYGRIGRVDEGLALLEAALERAVEMNRMVDAALWRSWQGRTLLENGNLSAAKNTVDRGIALSITYKERGNQATLLTLLGDIQLAMGKSGPKRVLGCFSEALAIAKELGMKPTMSRAHSGIARVYEVLDETEKSEAHARDARQIADEIGVHFWFEDDETEVSVRK